ncbi:MAG: DUF3800 domain-containing protein [Afipia sp.]|nr:DUF3800 domain-containing protein [Afipia sp.]
MYFDEAGFTGYNLLDPQQPIFTVASSDVGDDEAREILNASFPRYQGNEYKFTNIWGSGNRAGLLAFAERFSTLGSRAFVYIICKRFAVLTKIIDFLIEPMMTRAGYDFYSDGFAWKYSNYINYGLTEFADPSLFNAIVAAYQAFSRNPSGDSLRLLQWRLNVMKQSTDEPVQLFLDQMATGAELFDQYHDLETFRGSDELQLTTMHASIGHWRQRHSEDFEVIHDDSSNFLRHREMWERITNNNVPRQLHPMGDGTMVEYPLRVISTIAVDSRTSLGVQFCDILAGLAARQFSPATTGEDRAFMERLIKNGLGEFVFNGIRPDTVFPGQIPPRRLRGPDAVDQLMGIMFPNG